MEVPVALGVEVFLEDVCARRCVWDLADEHVRDGRVVGGVVPYDVLEERSRPVEPRRDLLGLHAGLEEVRRLEGRLLP